MGSTPTLGTKYWSLIAPFFVGVGLTYAYMGGVGVYFGIRLGMDKQYACRARGGCPPWLQRDNKIKPYYNKIITPLSLTNQSTFEIINTSKETTKRRQKKWND